MARRRWLPALLAVALAVTLAPAAPALSQISLEEVEARSVEFTVDIFPVPTPPIDPQLITDFIEGTLQFPTGTIRGRSTTVIEVTAPYDVSAVRMWLWRTVNLTSVRAEGHEVRAARSRDTITLTFATPLRPRTRVTLHFEFQGPSLPIWTEYTWVGSGEIYPELISPFGDFNQNRAPIRGTVSAPANMTIVSSGTLLGMTESGGRRTWRFQSDADSERTVVLGGLYVKRTLEAGPVPLDIYTERGRDRNAPKIAEMLTKSYEFQSRYLGPLPFKRLIVGTFPSFWEGASLLGVAYPGIMVLNDLMLQGTMPAPYNRDSFTLVVVAHELAHGYWGMELQAKGAGWICIWECFAEYTGLLTVEGVMGAQAFQVELDENRAWYGRYAGRDRPITFYTFANAGGPIAAAVRYAKGSLVLHMLRYVMGDQKFQQFLSTLVRDNRGKAIRLETVQEYAERAHGASLEPFFQQWFREVVLPDYQIAGATVTPEGSGFKATARLRNAGTGSMPVQVGFVLDNNQTVVGTVTIGAREEREVSVTTERRVVKVVADPGRWLIQSNYRNDEFTVPR